MGTVAVIQARVGSTRLPDKVFLEIGRKSLIWHVVNRLTFSKRIDRVVLATTTNPQDDRLEAWAKAQGVECFRGSEDDVLERFYQAACKINADVIVRITADDPLKDPFIIDEVIALREAKGLDFACNNNPPTFPEGLDTEVFTFDALQRAHAESRDPFEREHVTQFFYRNKEKFSQENIFNKADLSSFRWTIDTQEDLMMVQKIYAALYQEGKILLMDDILNFLKKNPDIAQMNSLVQRSAMYLKNTQVEKREGR